MKNLLPLLSTASKLPHGAHSRRALYPLNQLHLQSSCRTRRTGTTTTTTTRPPFAFTTQRHSITTTPPPPPPPPSSTPSPSPPQPSPLSETTTTDPTIPEPTDHRRRTNHEAAYRAFRHDRTRSTNTSFLYALSTFIGFVGLSYLSVPLYRIFCQTTGLGGTVQTDRSRFSESDYVPVPMEHRIRIGFNADRSRALPWSFQPDQKEVRVFPGETALAFFTAKNNGTKDIVGVSTYNIAPAKAGIYFNKIQCFCFEEQMLRAGEEVDMPVFFFIDPAFATDPAMSDVKSILLSYTFFESRHQSLHDAKA